MAEGGGGVGAGEGVGILIVLTLGQAVALHFVLMLAGQFCCSRSSILGRSSFCGLSVIALRVIDALMEILINQFAGVKLLQSVPILRLPLSPQTPMLVPHYPSLVAVNVCFGQHPLRHQDRHAAHVGLETRQSVVAGEN